MHPVLFRIGPLPVYSYGTALALAFLIGIALARKRAGRMGVDPELITDLSVYILIGTLAGARLFYVISDWSSFRGNPLDIFKIWQGGLVFQGGLFGGVAVALWYLKSRKVAPWRVGDVVIPSVALGHALGRIGCFLNGCCFGTPTNLPWGVTFPPESFAAQHFGLGHHIHPAQLYSALNALFVFFVLIIYTPRARFPGQVFWLYGVLYGVTRFLLEFLRVEPRVLFSFSLYQVVSGGMIVLSLVMLLILSRRWRTLKRSRQPVYRR